MDSNENAEQGTDVVVVNGKGSTGVQIPDGLGAPANVLWARALSLAVGADAKLAPTEAELVALKTAAFALENGVTLDSKTALVLVHNDIGAEKLKADNARKDAVIDGLKKQKSKAGKNVELTAMGSGPDGLRNVTAWALNPEKGLGALTLRSTIEASWDDGATFEPVKVFTEKLARLGNADAEKCADGTMYDMKYPGVNKQEGVTLIAKDGKAVGASMFFECRLHLPQRDARYKA